MTGKEALNNLIEELKWCCNDGIELTDYDKSMIEPIQRDLEELEHYRKVKSYIDRMQEKPFYQKTDSGRIYKYENKCIEYDFFEDAIDVIEYESELYIHVEDIEKEIIFYNDEIEAEYKKQQEKEMREYEERRKNNPVWYGAIFNGTSGGNK